MRSLFLLCLVALLVAEDAFVPNFSVFEVEGAAPVKPSVEVSEVPSLHVAAAPAAEVPVKAPVEEFSEHQINSIRSYLRKSTVTAKMVYDIECSNSEFGKYVAIKGAEGSELVIDGAGDTSIEVSAIVRNTGNQDHSGHGDASGTATDDLFSIDAGISLEGSYALFRKGDGFPDWESSTGNPYIYFRNQLVDGLQWTCECDSDVDTETCEELYGDASPTHSVSQCCAFDSYHLLAKNPVTPDGMDYDSDGPQRFRQNGDLYVGRCNQLKVGESAGFTVTCSAEGAALADVVDIYPSCASVGHNLALGVGVGLQNNKHHQVIASQIPPAKFVACVGTEGCKWGHGPHEASNDETCFSTPVSGALVDKSAGNSNNQYQDGSDVGPEYLNCEAIPGNTPTSGVPINNSSQTTEHSFQDSTDKGPVKDFTTCGVGGNPCVVSFTCQFGAGDCFGSDMDSDVLEYVKANTDCAASDVNKCGDSEGCRCSSIRKYIAPSEVACYPGYDEEGEDEDDGTSD